MTTRPLPWTRRLLRPAPLLALGWLLTACLVNLPAPEGPVHSWWEGHGAVIPHDSFPMECDACHLPGTWHELREDFTFDHEAETGVALEGAHDRARCLRCHNDRGPVASFAARGCRGCHEDRHQGRLGSDCAACHEQEDWSVREAIARHDQTRFPLVGAHASAGCFACHPGAEVGRYDRAPVECIACHQQDLAQATSPDHRTQGWTQGCQECHSPVAWSGAWFEHAQFPLAGAHASASCGSCHQNEVYAGTPRDCASCHLDDFNGTTDPSHTLAGFGTTCEACHSPQGWSPSSWSHPWPLTGAHGSASCTSCHDPASFQVAGTSCVDCHLSDYLGTQFPDHEQFSFSTACDSCHSTSSWQGALFDHRSWPLTGEHAGATCTACHDPATPAVPGSDCVDCHLGDYLATQDPDHQQAGFPTTCQSCHGTSSWDGASFSHRFPRNHGNASSCTSCHGSPVTPNNWSCTQCHSQGEMNDEHDRVGGYTYSSPACLNCHPNGEDD